MKICFLMYPWEECKKLDSTLRLIHECVKRGHLVAMTTPERLGIRDCVTMANCEIFERGQKVSPSIWGFYKNAVKSWKNVPMAGFDAVFMRANPPMDPLVLNFLDSVKDDVFVMNAVKGLREANNKIYTAAYYDPDHELIPTTHVSKDVEYLRQIIEESDQEQMIMKPLDGFGGRGVIIIEKSASKNIKSLLDFYVNNSGKGNKSQYVILQEYIPGAERGDVRVLMLNGEPIGAIRRVPSSNDMRSNVSAGGSVEKYKLAKDEVALCKKIGEKLVRDGLYFAGLDIIAGKLIEVNVMSPGALSEYNMLNKTKIQVPIIDFVEKTVLEKNRARKRKSDLDSMLEG